MGNLIRQVDENYSKYKSAEISATDFKYKMEDIEEQASDIKDNSYSLDYYAVLFIEEFNEKLNNEYCDISDFDLPYNDLMKCLDGTYKSDGYNKKCEFKDGAYFYLTDHWNDSGNGSGFNTYMHTDGTTMGYMDFTYSGVLTLKEATDLAKMMLGDNAELLDEPGSKYDYYKSRNLNYFHVFTVKNINHYETFCLTSDWRTKVYALYFFTNESPETEDIYPILDTMSEINL